MPKFEMPKFDNPKVEMPAAFREFAELGVAQAKDAYEKIRAPAEKATGVLEVTYGPAAKDATERDTWIDWEGIRLTAEWRPRTMKQASFISSTVQGGGKRRGYSF